MGPPSGGCQPGGGGDVRGGGVSGFPWQWELVAMVIEPGIKMLGGKERGSPPSHLGCLVSHWGAL